MNYTQKHINKYNTGSLYLNAYKMITAPLEGFVKNYIEIEKLMESHVGDTIIMKKDTLIVIDFSVTNDSYKLDNGLTVNRKIVENE